MAQWRSAARSESSIVTAIDIDMRMLLFLGLSVYNLEPPVDSKFSNLFMVGLSNTVCLYLMYLILSGLSTINTIWCICVDRYMYKCDYIHEFLNMIYIYVYIYT